MAVTVVAVVIFLCGVMVGRGVRAPRATELADAAIETPLDPTASVATAPSSTAGHIVVGSNGPDAGSDSHLGSCERDHATAGAAQGIGANRSRGQGNGTRENDGCRATPGRAGSEDSRGPSEANSAKDPGTKDAGTKDAKACGGERALVRASWCRWPRSRNVARRTRSRSVCHRKDFRRLSPRRVQAPHASIE